jgi:DNA-binding beta-propeller fold protein YncE
MVSGAPNQVHIYNPATQTDQVVPLSGTPENISLSPDGKYAAVGQGNTIDYIDLQNAASLKTLSVRYPVDDILLAGNGWIYTAADESPNSHLVAVEIDTNQEIFADVGFRIRSLQLSADGHSLYSVG